MLLVTPAILLTITEYPPTLTGCTLVISNVELVASVSGVFVSKYHWYDNGGVPAAATLNRTLWPGRTIWLCGCVVMVGATGVNRTADAQAIISLRVTRCDWIGASEIAIGLNAPDAISVHCSGGNSKFIEDNTTYAPFAGPFVPRRIMPVGSIRGSG